MCLGYPGSLRSLSNSHMGPHTRHLTVSFFAQQCDAQYQRPQDVSRVSLTRPDRQSTQSRRLSTTVGPTDRWNGPQPAHNAWYTAHAGPVQQHPAQTHCAAQANAAARTRMQTRRGRCGDEGGSSGAVGGAVGGARRLCIVSTNTHVRTKSCFGWERHCSVDGTLCAPSLSRALQCYPPGAGLWPS